jgi:flagellar biogenesis protein FliO
MLFMLLFAPLTLCAESQNPPQAEESSDALKTWEEENKPREDKEEVRFSELITRAMLLLIGILVALFIATWCMKKMDRFKFKTQDSPSRIELVEKKVLSPKSVLYIVEIDGKPLFLAESQTNGVQYLGALEDKKS